MPHKIVIDTNVWVSYFINARADYLIRWINDHDTLIFTSSELEEELEEVLMRPKFKNKLPFAVNDFIHLHRRVCNSIKIIKQYNLAPDVDDNFLFDLCKKSGAEFLVTSDKKLLDHLPSFPLEILTFNQLRNKI